MPDIAKCANSLCPLRTKCYRYRCIPSHYVQTYADFKPKNKKCEAFWDIKGYDKKDLLPEDYVCGNPFGDNNG